MREDVIPWRLGRDRPQRVRFTRVAIFALFSAVVIPSQVNAQQYYIIGRYYCVNVNDPNRDEGDCNITTNGNSCPAAMAAQRSAAAQAGDPCRQCAGVIDNSKRWTGRVDYNQGGPCQGFQ
jgi:hypothetical protein